MIVLLSEPQISMIEMMTVIPYPLPEAHPCVIILC